MDLAQMQIEEKWGSDVGMKSELDHEDNPVKRWILQAPI
jgi:hypothetical protein